VSQYNATAPRASAICRRANQNIAALSGPANTLAERLVLADAQIGILRRELRQLRSLPPPTGRWGPSSYAAMIAHYTDAVTLPLSTARGTPPSAFVGGSRSEGDSIARSIGMEECARQVQPPGIVRFEQVTAARAKQKAASEERYATRIQAEEGHVARRGNAICRRVAAKSRALPPLSKTIPGAIRGLGRIAQSLRDELAGLERLREPPGLGPLYRNLFRVMKHKIALEPTYIPVFKHHDVAGFLRLNKKNALLESEIAATAGSVGMTACGHIALPRYATPRLST
jgi:hypothetical protein